MTDRSSTIVVGANLKGALKRLKIDHDVNVRAALRRHEYFVGPAERARFKARRARQRSAREAARRESAEAR